MPKRLTNKQFINKANKIHDNKYDYSKVNYVNSQTKVIITCNKHGNFLQTSSHHLNRSDCPKCSNRISKSEIKWLNQVEKQSNIKLKRNLTIKINNRCFYPDGFDPITNTWYEYNGYYWHGHPDYYDPNDIHPTRKISFGELYQKTLEKEKLIKNAGYNLITKWGD